MLEFIKGPSVGGQIARLLLALVCGMAMGLDRELKNKRAGLKTYALVCVGAAISMIVSEYIVIDRPELTTDAARLGANVLTGVGFLGAATIILGNNYELKGLTTAAGLWTDAIIGLACGAGFVEAAIAATAIVLFVFIGLSHVDSALFHVSRGFDAHIGLRDAEDVGPLIDSILKLGIRISDLKITPHAAGATITFSGKTEEFGSKDAIIAKMKELPQIAYFEYH